MFTADDFKVMERKCPEERDELLRLLGIKVSLPFAEDDFPSYEKLDMTIKEKMNLSSRVTQKFLTRTV